MEVLMGRRTTKLIIFSMVALLLLTTLSSGAARLGLASRRLVTFEGVKTEDAEVMVEEGCEKGSSTGEGDQECLMRRTLVAHLDYIYTQKQKH